MIIVLYLKELEKKKSKPEGSRMEGIINNGEYEREQKIKKITKTKVVSLKR